MSKLTKRQIKKIKGFALKYYKKLDETHGVEHMKRIVKLAEYLAKKERANLQIVRFGALLHQFHNGKIVEKFLKKIKVDNEISKKLAEIAECSWAKKLEIKAKSLEAKIVWDADKLQVLGPFGVIREIACNVGARRKKFRDALKRARWITRNVYNFLQTKTAKKLAKKPHKFTLKFWKIFDKWNKVKL